jgi:quercetin dioxygenase-like cupin family protein
MQRLDLWLGAMLLLAPGIALSQSTLLVAPADVSWQDSRARPGTKVAILEGDPTRQGIFVTLAKFPANYDAPPHYHGATERGVVLTGSLYMGIGSVADRAKAKHLPAGSVWVLPALTPHFFYTTEETTLHVVASGPFQTTPVKAP